MENKLKNISVIINKYRLHLLDLVVFANAGRTDQNTNNIFKAIFTSIFTRLPKETTPFPIHISIYDHAIRDIKRSKKVFQKPPSTKDISSSINIEEFNPENYLDGDIFKALESIEKTQRIVLCLLIRHKLGIDELATLFSSTPGTILSRVAKSRTELAKTLINLKKNSNSKQIKLLSDCFYVRNMQTRQNYGLSSKEENSKINKHLQKCTACRNFYAWQDLVSTLIEQAPVPVPDRQINADIFYRLSKRSFLPNIWYTVHKSWIVRTSIFIGAIVLLLTVSSSYYYDKYYHQPSIALLNINSSEATTKVEKDNKLRPQNITSYKIKTTTRRRITITKNLNDLLNTLGAKTTDNIENTSETKIFSKEMNGLTYLNANLPKNSTEDFLSSIKEIDNAFEIIKHEETAYDTKPIETINVEIWIHRKNVR